MTGAYIRLLLDVIYVALYFILIYAFAQGIQWLNEVWPPPDAGLLIFGWLENALMWIDAAGVASAAALGTWRSLRILIQSPQGNP